MTVTLFGGGVDYGALASRVLGANLSAHWPMSETSGAVMNDLSASNFDGTYTGVTLNNRQSDLGPLARLDGLNDWADCGLAFRLAFGGSEGGFVAWIIVDDWSPAGPLNFITLQRDGNNFIRGYIDSALGLVLQYKAGVAGAQSVVINSVVGRTSLFHVGLTWSKANDRVRGYIDGVQSGGTQTGLGTWGGSLNVSDVGSAGGGSADFFDGWMQHIVIASAEPSPAQMLQLGKV